MRNIDDSWRGRIEAKHLQASCQGYREFDLPWYQADREWQECASAFWHCQQRRLDVKWNRSSSMAELKQRPVIIFLHLPKTAGSTLNVLFRRNYGAARFYRPLNFDDQQAVFQEFAHLPVEQRAVYEVISGHFQYGWHTVIPRASTYLTLLRDPVDRVLSYYYYINQLPPGHYLYDRVVRQKMSLEEFVTCPPTIEIDNFQLRWLAAAPPRPIGSCTRELLDQAKRNIETSFMLAGPTERFDEVLILMRHYLGWRRIFYASRNVNRKRPRRSQIEPRIIRAIETLNALDIELYQFVRLRFEQQLRQQIPNYERELKWFKRMNNGYGWLRVIGTPLRKMRVAIILGRKRKTVTASH